MLSIICEMHAGKTALFVHDDVNLVQQSVCIHPSVLQEQRAGAEHPRGSDVLLPAQLETAALWEAAGRRTRQETHWHISAPGGSRAESACWESLCERGSHVQTFKCKESMQQFLVYGQIFRNVEPAAVNDTRCILLFDDVSAHASLPPKSFPAWITRERVTFWHTSISKRSRKELSLMVTDWRADICSDFLNTWWPYLSYPENLKGSLSLTWRVSTERSSWALEVKAETLFKGKLKSSCFVCLGFFLDFWTHFVGCIINCLSIFCLTSLLLSISLLFEEGCSLKPDRNRKQPG